MTIYKNRKKMEGLSRRSGKIFSFLPANAWTLLGLVFILISVYFLVNREFLLTVLFFAAASFLDVIDGGVARYRGEASRFGAYFDTIADRYEEGIMALGLMIVVLPSFYLQSYIWAGIYLFGSGMVTYAKAAAKEKELVKEEIKGGLMERPERLLLLIVGIVLACFDPLYLTYVVVLLAVLTNITALQRIKIAISSNVEKKK